MLLWSCKTTRQRYNFRNLMADPNQKSVFLAYVALSIGVVCIGFSAIFVKIAGLRALSPLFTACLLLGLESCRGVFCGNQSAPHPKKPS
jgi:hypothetical protein